MRMYESARECLCVFRWSLLVCHTHSSHTSMTVIIHIYPMPAKNCTLVHLTPMVALAPLLSFSLVCRSHGLTIIIIPMVLKLPCDYLLEYYMCVPVRAIRTPFKLVEFSSFWWSNVCLCVCGILFLNAYSCVARQWEIPKKKPLFLNLGHIFFSSIHCKYLKWARRKGLRFQTKKKGNKCTFGI